jgi:hypothetical protein
MKRMAFILCVLAARAQSYAQGVAQPEPTKTDFKVFAEFSPFLAAFQLVSVGGGVEFSRYQIGASFTKGTHHFTHGLSATTFADFGTLHFLHNQTEEIFVKRYFKKSRQGLYVGLLFNLTHWEVQNHEQDIYVNTIGKYLTSYVGYRWFPFKNNDIFYVEPNFGVSVRLNGSELTKVGNQSFSFLQPPFELTPNVLIGARFKLKK